jgi:hypothetical protein
MLLRRGEPVSDAIRELEIELHGFYVGARVALGDSPEEPDDVRPTRILRFHTGEVVGTLNLSLRDAGVLSRQLNQGVDAPRRCAELAAALVKCRGGKA